MHTNVKDNGPQNGVADAEPHVTKLHLITVSASPRNRILNQGIRNPLTREVICLVDPCIP